MHIKKIITAGKNENMNVLKLNCVPSESEQKYRIIIQNQEMCSKANKNK